MPRYVKCRHCEETELYTERFDKMEIESKTSDTGKTKNFYYHKGDCWSKHQKEQDFIKDELKKKDELNDVIKSIYNLKFQIPPRIWELLQDLRNGTNRYQKFFKKKYKQGIPYDVLAQAYRMSTDSIKWAKLNRRFRNTEEELRYGVRIMQSKIEDAYKKIRMSEQTQKLSEAKEVDILRDIVDNREVGFVRKKREDLSDILGDD